MKNTLHLLTLSALILTTACTRIVFDAPQPKDGAPLGAFPLELRGTYAVPEDEVDSLVVTERTAAFYGKEQKELSLKEIKTASYVRMVSGKLWDTRYAEERSVPYLQNDSLITFALDTTLIFGLSDSFVLKRLDDRLVINFRSAFDGDYYWDAILIRAAGKKLVINTIGNVKSPDETGDSRNYDAHVKDFEAIAPYTQVQDKTFLFKPTTAQFHSMVKEKLFSEKEVYKRIR